MTVECRPLTGIAIALLVLLAPDAAAPSASVLMSKRLFALRDGRSMNLVCEGRGSPTLVFEYGLGGNLLHWQKIEAAASSLTTACFYDRAGYGFSDPSPRAMTAEAVVKDLHGLLAAAGVRDQVVLVGHSLGSLYATLYADIYPDQVAGLVLIDPSFAGQGNPARSVAGKTADRASYDQAQSETLKCASLAWQAKLTLADSHGCFLPSPTRTPQEIAYLFRQYSRPYRYESLFSEAQSMDAAEPGDDLDSRQEHARARSFGRKPVIVLTAGQSDSDDPVEQRLWKMGHDTLAARSSAGKSIVVPGAGHFIQVEQPNAVMAAIMEVVRQVRDQAR